MIRYTLKEIATALKAEAFGAVAMLVERAAEPASAGPKDLAIAMDPKYANDIASGRAEVAILWKGADWKGMGLKGAILVPRARVAMAGLTEIFSRPPNIPQGIHPSAVVDTSSRIGTGACIAPLVVVGADAIIGKNAVIGSHVSIGAGAIIGDNALIHSGVRIQENVTIGDNFIAQPGATIGGDGFSFVTAEKSGVETARETLGNQGDAKPQSWIRIHSLGGVRIGDDVEVGANTTIDQGTIRPTSIGNGTKIDNQVQVGHNVIVGRDCLLCGQVGIAGSTRIGNNVVLGGQVGVVDNIIIGDGVVAGGGTTILSNAPPGQVMMGYPAMKMETSIESYKALRRLPRLIREVRDLQKLVSKTRQND